jgi:hypothetical protein
LICYRKYEFSKKKEQEENLCVKMNRWWYVELRKDSSANVKGFNTQKLYHKRWEECKYAAT